MRNKTILATLIIIAVVLLTSAVLAVARSASRPDKNIHAVTASNSSTVMTSQTFEIQQEDTAALTSTTEEFRARKVITSSTPNFSTPLRRAPLRRKGNVQG